MFDQLVFHLMAAIHKVQMGGIMWATLNRPIASQPTNKAETMISRATFDPTIASALVWP